MRPIKPWKRKIAPRLANGKSRESWGGRLPEAIKYGLYKIAKKEGKSVSWVMEEVIIAFFDLERPDYLVAKTTKADDAKKESQDLAEAHARDAHRKRVA